MPQQLRVVVLRMANGQIRKETGLFAQGDRLQHRHGHCSVDIRLMNLHFRPIVTGKPCRQVRLKL